MKLGISYNVFDDSIELLKRSISTVRNFADHVSVVYQDISNSGQPAIINIIGLLESLKEKKLIDKIIFFQPNYYSALPLMKWQNATPDCNMQSQSV